MRTRVHKRTKLPRHGLDELLHCPVLAANKADYTWGPGGWVWVSEVGKQGRDPGRVFAARCQAGRKDITLAEPTALRGMEFSNRNPKSPTVSASFFVHCSQHHTLY